MNFKLHQAICAANYAIGQMMTTDFNADHRIDTKPSIRASRQYLMDTSDALSSYQAEIKAAAAKVAA